MRKQIKIKTYNKKAMNKKSTNNKNKKTIRNIKFKANKNIKHKIKLIKHKNQRKKTKI